MAASHARQMAKEGKLDVEFAHTVVSLIQGHNDHVATLVGYESTAMKERAEITERIRSANIRIRELEALLGQGVTPEALQAGIQFMSKRLSAWWERMGFNYISDIDFGRYGVIKAKFGFSFDWGETLGRRPATSAVENQASIEHLKNDGWVLTGLESRRRHDVQMVDCESNRKKLMALFREHLPTAIVHAFDGWRDRDSEETFVLRHVEVYIKDLNEVYNLPDQVATQ